MDIFNWINLITDSTFKLLNFISDFLIILFSIIFIIYFVFLWFKKSHKNKKLKNILNSQEYVNVINGEKQKLRNNVEKYFSEIFISTFNIKLFNKFITTEIGPGKKPTKIAWNFFILLTTSVLANKSEGKISEAVDSILNVFKEGKKLLLLIENSSLITDVILKILNFKIRPILTDTRSLPQIWFNDHWMINDEKLSGIQVNHFWKQINQLRKELIEEKYLHFISVLSLSEHTNEDIINLLNYSLKTKTTQEDKDTEIAINESISKIKETVEN